MILEDHICLIPNPLIGKNLYDFGPRCSIILEQLYDKNLLNLHRILSLKKYSFEKVEHWWNNAYS